MNIALIGSGGREHALCQKLSESKGKNNIYCIPGNAGTSKIATNLDLDYLDHKSLLRAFKSLKIHLVVIGPEQPLVNGLVDYLQKNKIPAFGPNKYAAKLEGSKVFMKNLCKQNSIPTAGFKVCKNNYEVKKFLENNKLPIVVKADGLAAGKGVSICKKEEEVIKKCNEIFLGKFKSSKKVVLEEFLFGEELSYFLIVDKSKFSFIGSAQDHKRVGVNETGPNTGGMGAYSPSPLVNQKLERKIIHRIVKPTLLHFKKKNKPYVGFLYVGLMIKNNNPYLIEYNIRMGDPECQVIIPRLDTDLLKIINATVHNRLNEIKIKWKKLKCMTVVLCAKGYPGNHIKNSQIKNMKKIKLHKNSFIFHAGTMLKSNKLLSKGGRVLNVTSTGKSFLMIRKNIFKIIKKINWKQGFFRKDIGWRVINKL